ncbi:MMPL family transporter [Nitratireductor mangrovi]|uniref:MMPL family transporter n=1 Tax=Nitratireductor mangrovi TaxID=2599600 RepID=A0A5B8KYP5_9HYPH|nr:MMPL family transporter [Nitratireductor mangrovi]QDZ00656.1 MMPL family transporter [Nitratireductor mangrovi]
MGKGEGRAIAGTLAFCWLVLLAVDLAAGLGIARLRFDDGLQDAFVSDDDWFRDHQRFDRLFTGPDGDLVVLFEAPDFAAPEALERISDFVLEAGFIEGVADTTSIFTLRRPPGPGGMADPILPAVLPDRDGLATLLDEMRITAPAAGALLSHDRRLTAVVVTLADGGRSLKTARPVAAALAGLADTALAGSGISYSLTGVAMLRAAIVDGLYQDLVVLVIAGVAFGFVVCTVAMRSPLLALLGTLPSATALILVLGVFGALGFRISVLTVALPVLILVISFADSVHLTFELARQARAGRASPQAEFEALRRVGPACALASLTTAIAFGGLMVSGSTLIRELGVAGLLAGIVSLVAVLFVHPLVFATAAHWRGLDRLFAGKKGIAPAFFDWRALPALALASPLPVAAGAGLLLAAAVAIYPSIEPVHSLRENIYDDRSVIVALDRIDRELAPVNAIHIPVRIDGRLDAAAFGRARQVHDIAQATAPDGSARSLVSLAAGLADVGAGEQAARVDALLARMQASRQGRFVSSDGDWALVRLHVADEGARATRDLVGRLDAALAAAGFADRDVVARPTGFLVMSSFVSARMITDLNYCFLIAVAASGLLILLWSRNLRYGLVALMPNVLPIALVGAGLALSGRGLQFSSGVALTIAFGIAVDDTVHVLNRLRLNAPPGEPFDPAALRRAMAEVTPVLVVTTAVLSVGLTADFLSTVPTAAYFGALSILVLWLAVVADLLVLPAWLRLMGPSERTAPGRRFA